MAKSKPAVKRAARFTFTDGRVLVVNPPGPRDLLLLERKGVKFKRNKPVESTFKVAWVKDGQPSDFESWLDTIADMDYVDGEPVEPGKP